MADPKVLCGVWMPKAKEPCARMAGHADEHRTRYALDNLRDSRRVGHREYAVR